jgi:solute:Na+ symporter, SSS family
VGAGGFFALPYTILVFPLVFLVMPRLWSVASNHGYVTAADFVRGRFSSRGLATAIAFTGLLATMPYIALQLVGIQVVLEGLGIQGEWPLIIAFAVLAAYTYTSGLRAPAMIALVKDTLIYVTVIVAIVYIPSKVGGWDNIFNSAAQALPGRDEPGALIPGTSDAHVAYATLAPAPRWRCSCTRTRSRPSSAPSLRTWCAATCHCSLPGPFCSASWPCSATWRSRRA